jgi:cysteine-rich repeat protein
MSLRTWTALLVAALAACGGETVATPVLGNVTVLILADTGLPLQRIDYEIMGRSNPVKGSVRIDDLTRTISTNVRGLPVGKGYQLVLAAASPDGDLSCGGKSGFEVMATQTTAVSARLTCTSRSGASTAGTVRTYCPLVRSTSVAPAQTAVGGSVVLAVEVVIPDGTVLPVFTWSGVGGSFVNPAAATTAFKCEQEGDHVLTLRITAGACADRTTVIVKCAGMTCGNGKLDLGETCDDGNQVDGDACPADCLLPGCGNGKLDPQETCEPPGSATCDLQCRKVTGCGNGVVEAGEACDDANHQAGDGCAADCTTEALCGNGQVEPGEECEPPGVGACNALCRSGPSL